MDSQMANTIKQDFLAWSGGFPPESDDQIYVYIETAKRPEIDDEELCSAPNLDEWRRLLRAGHLECHNHRGNTTCRDSSLSATMRRLYSSARSKHISPAVIFRSVEISVILPAT